MIYVTAFNLFFTTVLKTKKKGFFFWERDQDRDIKNVYSQKYNFNCSVTENIQVEL